jgi:hypothetical protein
MKQFTMNIDESLLHAAKLHALQHGTTVSDLVRSMLLERLGVKPVGNVRLDDSDIDRVLSLYSAGEIDRRDAFEQLGFSVDQFGDFADLMNERRLQWPALDPKASAEQGEIVAALIVGDADED